MKSLINLLTVDQRTAAKEGRIVWLTNAAQRNSITKLGFAVDCTQIAMYPYRAILMRMV
jgi:hypothetical protein